MYVLGTYLSQGRQSSSAGVVGADCDDGVVDELLEDDNSWLHVSQDVSNMMRQVSATAQNERKRRRQQCNDK